jgi:hypothetical protein
MESLEEEITPSIAENKQRIAYLIPQSAFPSDVRKIWRIYGAGIASLVIFVPSAV